MPDAPLPSSRFAPLDTLRHFERFGVWERDLRTGQGRWDPYIFRLYALPPGVAPSMEEASRFFHPDDVAPMFDTWRRSITQPGRYSTHFRLCPPGGRVRHVHSLWDVFADEHGTPVRAIGVLIDDTESVELAQGKQATERQLQHAEQRALLATRAAGMGVWERDLGTGRTHWDDQMRRLRGLAVDDPRTTDEQRVDAIHPQDRERVLDYADWVAREGGEGQIEYRVVWPDGTVRWLASRGMVVRDAEGRAQRLIGVNWDVTEQRRTEELRREHEAAERASRAKSEFLARMSHELRTPLNAVIGFAQLLQLDTDPLTDRQRERLQHIRAAGEHLLALINDTLDLASIEAGTLPLADQEVLLAPMVADALRWIEPSAARAGLTLRSAPIEAVVRGDARRIRQVLLNLLTNAVKYNRPGGSVSLLVRAACDGCVGVEVADSGRGMTAAQLERLFEPFERLGTEREGIEGTGIGLTIVRHLVALMGGRVEVDSAPGVGSRFTVWLPTA